MKQERNRIHKKGDRNVFCPYYGDWLDYLIKQSWKGWDCCGCRHRLTEEFWTDAQLINGDSPTDYDLFRRFISKWTRNAIKPFSTPVIMYTACGRLFKQGLRGVEQKTQV